MKRWAQEWEGIQGKAAAGTKGNLRAEGWAGIQVSAGRGGSWEAQRVTSASDLGEGPRAEVGHDWSGWSSYVWGRSSFDAWPL